MTTDTHRGALFAVLAFGWWGLSPLYFKWVSHVAPQEVLANRVVWSFVLMSALLWFSYKARGIASILKSRKQLLAMLGSSLLIATNWLTFIWAVGENRVLEASMGYYINPLVSIFLGMIFLHERLTQVQKIALLLAATGVTIQVVAIGELPWVSLVLAFTFGFYGLLRKLVPTDAYTGLWFETAMVLPLAVAYLLLLGGGSLTTSVPEFGKLFLAGVVTTAPLIWFAIATKHLPLITLGFIQYLAPTIALLLAVTVFGEQLTLIKTLTFVFIWAALLLIVLHALRQRKQLRNSG
ncbi:EamA family transporter RarD [Bacterioplanoides sp.]|uniref:EamA family transporter RarD n=1 Tax=Bacterioplanoides sp. TaxID=2066072 RepID=UPI003B00C15A